VIPSPSMAAVLGFAFAAAWAQWGLGWALLCLVCAALFGLVAWLLGSGWPVLEDLRERAEAARSGFAAPPRD
jgi:hypothetical protein